MEFRVLGAFELLHSGTVRTLPVSGELTLLALLVLNAPATSHPADTLIDASWGRATSGQSPPMPCRSGCRSCGGRYRRRAYPTRCWPLGGHLAVWRKLTGALDGLPIPKITGTGLWHTRARLGVRPLRALFDLLRGHAAATRTTGTRWCGLLVVAIDGTHLDVPDNPATRTGLGKRSNQYTQASGYPQISLVALVACGARAIIDAVFGPASTGESTYAARLTRSLHPGGQWQTGPGHQLQLNPAGGDDAADQDDHQQVRDKQQRCSHRQGTVACRHGHGIGLNHAFVYAPPPHAGSRSLRNGCSRRQSAFGVPIPSGPARPLGHPA